jgi:predicted ATPase
VAARVRLNVVSRKRRKSISRLSEIRMVEGDRDAESYPYSIPAIAALDRLEVAPGVTFIVGENGSGKSTLVEAIAISAGLNAEGGSHNLKFETRGSESDLHHSLELVWERHPTAKFFLRAETFYNTATAYEEVGKGGYHERSHGESFLSVNGQLKLMCALRDLLDDGSQFVIATHSPILLTFPEARIYRMGTEGITPITYEESDAYQLTKAYLAGPEQFLRHLFADE